MKRLLLAGLSLVCAAASAAPCGAELPLRTQAGPYTVAFAPRPAKIAVGQHFALDIAACAEPGAAELRGLRVDADMPAHRHGMNYRATVAAQGPGRHRAEGLMFHMAGRWRFLFELSTAGGPVRLAHEVQIE